MANAGVSNCSSVISTEVEINNVKNNSTRCSNCKKSVNDDASNNDQSIESILEKSVDWNKSSKNSKEKCRMEKSFSSTPSKDHKSGSDLDDSNYDYSGGLSVVVTPTKKKRRFKEVLFNNNKEIEDEIEDQLKRKAKKSNLTVANVKSILRHVIENDSIINMIKKSMRSNVSNDKDDLDFCYEPKLTRSKTKQLLQSQPEMVWPITPIKKIPESEHLIFINEELPEESDDEEYKPSPDDLQDQSEEESGRQSVVSSISVSSTLDASVSQYLENFDSNLLNSEPFNRPPDQVFKIPEENIGQRTRSKLCLSDTPLEAIEKAFVPPDITTDMYDFKCDNEDWENFLKEFMQPLPSDANEPEDDDEADPEYNAMADEEEVDKEELRMDRAVKIPRKELRKLMAELFECPDDLTSDEEEEGRVRREIISRVDSEIKEKSQLREEEIEDRQDTLLTSAQKLLMEQQLRQHVQLTTQNFLQTYQHPLYGKHARECKVLLAELVELAKLNENSLFNVYNLKSAFKLVEDWEKYLMSEKGPEVIEHMKKEVKAAQKLKQKNNYYRVNFHPKLMEFMTKSDVFLYPLLLPPQAFRCDGPFRVEFVPPEDYLIAIGLDEFTPYLAKNPRWFDKKKTTERAVVELICKYLLPTKKIPTVIRHIQNAKIVESNPICYYRIHKKSPKTVHYVIPFNNYLTKPPCQQDKALLPKNFRDFLYPENADEDKENDNDSNS